MEKQDAVVGTRVRSVVVFSGLPRGTEGVIDFDYGFGFMIAWDLPDRPLPEGYAEWDGGITFADGGLLRDGFDKDTEIGFLEVV